MKRLLPLMLLVALLASCRGGEILMDEDGQVKMSETLNAFRAVADSMSYTIRTDGEWTIGIAESGKQWCTVSKNCGTGGVDSIVYIYVTENPTAKERVTALIIKSGSMILTCKVSQRAGEEWFETDYWHRTDLQKMGMRGRIKSIKETSPLDYINMMTFDRKGNLTRYEEAKYDTGERKYTNAAITAMEYDEFGHRTSAVTTNENGDTTMAMSCKYENQGKLVAVESTVDPQMSFKSDVAFLNSFVLDLSEMDMVTVTDSRTLFRNCRYEFKDGKEYIYRKDTYLQTGTTTVLAQSADTLYWVVKNDKPYSHVDLEHKVTNIIYSSNGMFYFLDADDHIYRYHDTHLVMKVASDSLRANITPAAGEVYKRIYSFNSNHDVTACKVYVYPDKLYNERGSVFYDDNTQNWVSMDYTSYDPLQQEMPQAYLRREFTYFEDK